MNKQIPYLFSGSISAPTRISESNPSIGRAQVKVFTKYGNRNGSYITESVAQQLIDSAPNCPVVGFFDPQTGDWGTHVGPTLASAYGYVENFEGWESETDSDGVDRDYAIFSVILFSDYFEQANKIVGKSQSMELDCNSIDGEWTTIDGNEYFVYSKAKMHGFCVLGDEVEPCFSSSVFFNKEENGETQFEKFSKLLFELREKVEKLEGGETVMDVNENLQQEEVSTAFEEVTEQPIAEGVAPVVEEAAPVAEEVVEYSNEEEQVAEENTVAETTEFEEAAENETPAEEVAPVVDYEALYNELKGQYDALVASNNEMVANYDATIAENKQTIDSLNMALTAANEKISTYEAQAVEVAKAQKDALIEKYSDELPEEQYSVIMDSANDLSYEELESKFAIAFANYTMNKKEKDVLRVAINQPEESDFAKLMKNYKRV